MTSCQYCSKPATTRIRGSGPGVWHACDKHTEIQRLIHGSLLTYDAIAND
jgi:hypothetical protein